MKAQGLSMQTIAVIIIAIIVLAAVVIFFFAYYGKSNKLVGQQTNYSGNKVDCAAIQSCVYKEDVSSCGDIGSKCGTLDGCTVYLNDGTECKCSGGSWS